MTDCFLMTNKYFPKMPRTVVLVTSWANYTRLTCVSLFRVQYFNLIFQLILDHVSIQIYLIISYKAQCLPVVDRTTSCLNK